MLVGALVLQVEVGCDLRHMASFDHLNHVVEQDDGHVNEACANGVDVCVATGSMNAAVKLFICCQTHDVQLGQHLTIRGQECDLIGVDVVIFQ